VSGRLSCNGITEVFLLTAYGFEADQRPASLRYAIITARGLKEIILRIRRGECHSE
jgi:hypothetical protein